ncbi:MAG: DUF3467 domain-containing protein [Planctomycetota bacterium]
MTADNRREMQPQDIRQRINIDETDCTETYSNFFSVTGSPEEIALDFGLMHREIKHTVRLKARIYLNYYNAKRLLTGLTQSIKKYEETYGPLELDPRKRARKK